MGDFLACMVLLIFICIATGRLDIKVPIHFENGDCKLLVFDSKRTTIKESCDDY